jgi:hypothetical protein
MMKNDVYIPSVIDFAYEIIDLHRENIELRRKVEHLEELDKIHRESWADSDKHQKEFLGIMLSAAIDPDSHINRANAALIEKECKEATK